MHLEQILKATSYCITEGSEYLWQCYPNARILVCTSEYAYTSVVHSTVDQTVYEVTVDSNDRDLPIYRWRNPDFIEAYNNESFARSIDPDEALEGLKFMDTESEKDILDKVTAMMNGEEVDPTVEIMLNFSDEELLKFMCRAHEANMTFNEYCNLALSEFVKSYEKELNDNP
jgi:hypothetical protein